MRLLLLLAGREWRRHLTEVRFGTQISVEAAAAPREAWAPFHAAIEDKPRILEGRCISWIVPHAVGQI